MWIVAAVVALVGAPILVAGVNEARLRRRHDAVATRRKVKHRL